MLAIYILLQQTLICLFCSLFCSCSLWFCLFVSAACSSACWWRRGYRLMMVVALICLAEKYRANRMQHCRPEIGSSVDNLLHGTRSKNNVARKLKETNFIKILRYPAQSPDLNPTEGIWNILK